MIQLFIYDIKIFSADIQQDGSKDKNSMQYNVYTSKISKKHTYTLYKYVYVYKYLFLKRKKNRAGKKYGKKKFSQFCVLLSLSLSPEFYSNCKPNQRKFHIWRDTHNLLCNLPTFSTFFPSINGAEGDQFSAAVRCFLKGEFDKIPIPPPQIIRFEIECKIS